MGIYVEPKNSKTPNLTDTQVGGDCQGLGWTAGKMSEGNQKAQTSSREAGEVLGGVM